MPGPGVAPSGADTDPNQQTELPDLENLVGEERKGIRHALNALSESDIERLKGTFRQWIGEMYEIGRMGSDAINYFSNFKELTERIYAEVDPDQRQQAATLFFNEFIDFVIASDRTNKLDQLLKELNYSISYGGYNLSNYVGFSNYMHLLARMSRTRGMRHMVYNSIEADVSLTEKVTQFARNHPEDIIEFVNSISQLSISRQLEMIGFFEFLAFLLTGDDDEGISPHFLIGIIESLIVQTPSALISHIALLAKKRVEKAITDMNEWKYKTFEPEFWMSDDEIASNRGLEGNEKERFIDAMARENIEEGKERQQGEGVLYQRFNDEDSAVSKSLLREINFVIPQLGGAPIPLEEFPAFSDYYQNSDDISDLTQYIIASKISYEDRVGRDIRPLRISSDYIGIFDDSSLVRYVAECKKLPLPKENGEKITLSITSLGEITRHLSFNPFQKISAEDIPLLLQQLHRPRTREKLEEELGLKLKEMPLATQFQLLRFMAEESEETFAKLRHVLPGEDESRQHFLTAFLACAKDRNYGHKILKLAEGHPDKAGRIFERFYQIISITQQEEEKLKKALETNPALTNQPNLTRLYQTMIARGAELLSDAYNNINQIEDIDRYLQEAKRYQLKLIAFRGIFDAITAEDMHVSPNEIGQLTADQIKAEIQKGGDLLTFNLDGLSANEIQEKLLNKDSYKHPEHFGKEDYLMIERNIRNTYKDIDEGWAEYLVSRIAHNLMNPDSNFILIRNEEGELVGVGRSDKLGDNHFYMGTFYVEDGYQGIGRYIGEYLKTELPPNAEIEGTTTPSNPATMWHIEINGYVGKQIVREGDSGPLIECSNFPGKTFVTKDKTRFSPTSIKAKGPGDLEGGQIKILKVDTRSEKASENIESLQPFLEREGYYLTRFFYDDPKAQEPAANTWIVLEKAA